MMRMVEVDMFFSLFWFCIAIETFDFHQDQTEVADDHQNTMQCGLVGQFTLQYGIAADYPLE